MSITQRVPELLTVDAFCSLGSIGRTKCYEEIKPVACARSRSAAPAASPTAKPSAGLKACRAARTPRAPHHRLTAFQDPAMLPEPVTPTFDADVSQLSSQDQEQIMRMIRDGLLASVVIEGAVWISCAELVHYTSGDAFASLLG